MLHVPRYHLPKPHELLPGSSAVAAAADTGIWALQLAAPPRPLQISKTGSPGSAWCQKVSINISLCGESQFFNPPSSTVRNSKLQVNRPKSLSCIISSLAGALRDSSYRAAAEQLSRPAEQAGKVRACRGAASPHPAGYLGQVDVLTSGHALSVIHPNTPGLGRVRGTCGDASVPCARASEAVPGQVPEPRRAGQASDQRRRNLHCHQVYCQVYIQVRERRKARVHDDSDCPTSKKGS
eukprot:COSAG01_NODE_8392_length_2803_cov_46.105030_2_plen_238_part_00